MNTTRWLGDHGTGDAAPIAAFEAAPGRLPLGMWRLTGERRRGETPAGPLADDLAHSHQFLVLAYVERGEGTLRLGSGQWRLAAGDLYVVSIGEVVALSDAGTDGLEGWAAFFLPEVLGARAPGVFLSWRSHPLLFPFIRGAAGAAQRLIVPPEQRELWSARCSALEMELRGRRSGYREACLAHLTLLLIELSRLAVDGPPGTGLGGDPLLGDVFAFIEQRYREPISLRDVARATGLTPAHLTTIVGRRTGRTVLEWIVERRLAEARHLLGESDLPVAEIGRRVGYPDPHYFARVFRRTHGVAPLGWRRADRAAPTA